MMLPVSKPIYDLIPILAYVQFPWRFLVLSVFSSSLLVLSIEQWIGKDVVARIAGAYMFVGIAALLYMFYSQYVIPLSHVYLEDEARYSAVPVKDLSNMADNNKVTNAWEIWDLDYFRAQGASGTERDEYLPKFVNLDSIPSETADDVKWAGTGDVSIEIMESKPDKISATISTGHAGMLEFQHFYFPGWGVTVNGEPTSMRIHPEKGTMILQVADGVSNVVLTFGHTLIRRISAVISVICLVLLLAFTLFSKKEANAG